MTPGPVVTEEDRRLAPDEVFAVYVQRREGKRLLRLVLRDADGERQVYGRVLSDDPSLSKEHDQVRATALARQAMSALDVHVRSAIARALQEA